MRNAQISARRRIFSTPLLGPTLPRLLSRRDHPRCAGR
jgi:hypothetical protein